MRAVPGTEWPLTGRTRELRTLVPLTRSGRPGVLIAGPAGVGKTRLLREIAGAAGDAIVISANRTTAAIPLGAFAPVLPARPDHTPLSGDVLRWAADAILELGAKARLVAVDDSQALDAASTAVLGMLVAAGRTIALTLRTDEPVLDAVTALWKDSGVERLDLGPLAIDDVDALLSAALGGPVEGKTRRELWSVSQGNALYLRELVLGAVDSGFLVDEAGVWRLVRPLSASPRLHELVDARLADVGDDDRVTVDLLAVGEPLALELLRTLTSIESIERLEARGHVIVADDAVRLAHPVHGEVLRGRLGGLRRMALSRRLADAVDAGAPAPDLLRLARWRLDGGASVDPESLVVAARAAFVAHDDELADRLADAAVDAGGGVPARLVRLQILGALGRHQERAALFPELLADAGDDEERAKVTMAWAETLFWDLADPPRANAVLAAVAATLDPDGWRQELLVQRATYALLAGDVQGAVAAAAPLLVDGVRGLAQVSATMITTLALALQGRGSLAHAVARVGMARHHTSDPEQVGTDPAMLRVSAVVALIEAGRAPEACNEATAGYETAVARGDTSIQGWFALVHARALIATGQVASADRWFREAGAVYAAIGPSTNPQRRLAVAGRVIASALRGDRDECRSLLAQLDAIVADAMPLFEADVLRARAWGAWALGDRRAATALFGAAIAVADALGTVAATAFALHDAARLGLISPDAATAALQRIRPVDGELHGLRASHVAALASGEPEALLDVSHRLEEAGMVLLAAEAAASAAGRLRRRGDRRPASAAAARAHQLADRCEGGRPVGLDQAGEGGALTAREREVAELAATGLTSRAIADTLHVSPRTVDNLLARAYQKLGITSRAELADALG